MNPWLDDGPGPALPLSDFEEERMVQNILDDWSASAPEAAWAAGTPRRRPSLAVAAIAALVLLAPTAWAASWAWTAWVDAAQARRGPAPERSGPEPVEAAELASTPPSEARPSSAPELAGPTGPTPVASEGVAPKSEPASAEPKAERPRPVRRGPGAPAPSVPAVGPHPRIVESSAALVRASELRRQRRWRAAVEIYAQVRRTGAAAEAHVAAVAEGQLRLDHLGEARGALRAFRAAQARLPNGPLGAEARLGEGSALAASGDLDGARAVWKALVRDLPHTEAARTARQRLRP